MNYKLWAIPAPLNSRKKPWEANFTGEQSSIQASSQFDTINYSQWAVSCNGLSNSQAESFLRRLAMNYEHILGRGFSQIFTDFLF